MKKQKHSYQNQSEAESPEAKAFENLAKKILSVPKEEIDRREQQNRKEKPDS